MSRASIPACQSLPAVDPGPLSDLLRQRPRRDDACSLRIESQKLIKLFGMKYATVRINDVHLPASLKQNPSLRHGDGWPKVKSPRALAVF
jgi:hypothetical protein